MYWLISLGLVGLGVCLYFLYIRNIQKILKLSKENDDLNKLLQIRTDKIKEKNMIIKELKSAIGGANETKNRQSR